MPKKGAQVFGVDLSLIGLRLACQEFTKRGHLSSVFVASWGDCLPFADRTFDVVVLCEVIEHVEDPAGLLREVVRALTPDGVLLLSTACRLAEQPHPTHYQEFYPNQLRSVLESWFCHVEIQPYVAQVKAGGQSCARSG